MSGSNAADGLQASGAGRFRIEGALGFTTAGALLVRSKKMFEGQGAIEIDLAGVSQADSAGLALLLEWLNWGRHYGREVKFSNLPEQIQAIARISEVEDLLQPSPRP